MSHCALCVLSATITISFTSVIILQSFYSPALICSVAVSSIYYLLHYYVNVRGWELLIN